MKIQHVELIVAALSVALLFIAWSLLRTFLSSRLRKPGVSQARAARRQSGGWRRMTVRKLGLRPGQAHPEVTRLRQLRPVSAYDSDAFARGDGLASLACQIEARLELAFEQFSRGRISIRTYRSLAEIEADLIAERIAEAHGYWPGRAVSPLGEPELDPDLADAMAIVQWCLDWADDMMRKLGVEDGGERMDAPGAHALQTA
jgi:hypothetical protein